jgi:acyl-CoA synthetase (AMP-forming)/AMP-acid ligase II
VLESLTTILPRAAERYGTRTAIEIEDRSFSFAELDELAKAYIVLKDGSEPDVDGIMAHCRDHLAAYKVPREIQFVAELPTTSTGKIMRRELHTLDTPGAGA